MYFRKWGEGKGMRPDSYLGGDTHTHRGDAFFTVITFKTASSTLPHTAFLEKGGNNPYL